jgi:4-hydroxy-4-methyl-2-oxoglutarate aldolase
MAAQNVALTIHRDFQRAARHLVRGFAGTPTGNICDAQGRVGAIDYRIKSVGRSAAFAGVALTVHAGPRDNLAPWAAMEVVKPGDVIVIATGDHTAASVIGDIYVGMAKNAGVAAIVTDGVVRDLPGIEATGIPVFARGLSPNSPWKNGPGSVGLSVVVGGVTVEAGDIVVGDTDGVVIVSRLRAAAVLEELKAVRKKEAQMEAAVKAGRIVPGWLAETLKTKGVKYLD